MIGSQPCFSRKEPKAYTIYQPNCLTYASFKIEPDNSPKEATTTIPPPSFHYEYFAIFASVLNSAGVTTLPPSQLTLLVRCWYKFFFWNWAIINLLVPFFWKESATFCTKMQLYGIEVGSLERCFFFPPPYNSTACQDHSAVRILFHNLWALFLSLPPWKSLNLI